MPTWLVHGFRWPRKAIRIHIILQNLDDCAPEWLMAPATAAELTENFCKMYPEQMAHLPSLRFMEQYDPDDLSVKDQPFAYVCDQVHDIRLSADIDDVRGQGVKSDVWSALAELRDHIAPGEKVGWFVVVNGDVERWAPPLEGDKAEAEAEASENGAESQLSPVSQRSSVGRVEEMNGETKQRGLKKWLGRVKKARSTKDIRSEMAVRNAPLSPPLPKIPPSVALNQKSVNGKASVPSSGA